jgi:acetyl-CoA acyltransferase
MNAYIVAGYRSAVGKATRGGFRFTRPDDLGAEVIRHLLEKLPDLDPVRVDDVIVGNAVPEAEQGMQMGRYVALLALPKNVSGITINRYCGSGIEAIAMASAKIHAGMAECIIAGGTESMSLVPTMGWKTALNYEIAHSNPDYYLSMGLTAEQVSKEFKISREKQDEFAYQSHQKALNAQMKGYFDEGDRNLF